MQEIKKRRIVIASVLKPVDDTRMFEKIGQSLAGTFDVHVIGYPSMATPSPVNMSLHSLNYFSRLSISRIFSPFRILKKVFGLKPSILIITTHELLFIGVLYKLISGTNLIYDIQENYYRNIRHTKAFPSIIRNMVAGYVRLKEKLLAPAVSHFFLAEKSYAQELTFIGKRATILENKLLRTHARARHNITLDQKNLTLLFSGTLAESTGVFIAIDVAEKLHQTNPSVELVIMGYCADQDVLKTIQNRIARKPYINLIGGSHLIPHRQILQAIKDADLGLVCYPPNPSTSGSVPTKLYEYLGQSLPILLIDYTPWKALCEAVNAAITFNPEAIDPSALIGQIRSESFYSASIMGIFWEDEAPKLLAVISSLKT